MVKYFSRLSSTTGWILLLSFFTLAIEPKTGLHADSGQAVRHEPVQRISSVLAERLDQFPRARIPQLANHFLVLCEKFRFDPAFILSLIQVESSFKVHALSPAGAIGLMQLMPATAQYVANRIRVRYSGPADLKNPFLNLTLGVAYLSELRERYRRHSPYVHVAAYNVGPARMDFLMSKKNFKPVQTKRYYEAIRDGAAHFARKVRGASSPRKVKVGSPGV
jgi:soluble lytic murein transglycosylase-like protein